MVTFRVVFKIGSTYFWNKNEAIARFVQDDSALRVEEVKLSVLRIDELIARCLNREGFEHTSKIIKSKEEKIDDKDNTEVGSAQTNWEGPD
jgi:hypothetical protein